MRILYITNTYLQGRSGVVNASKAFVNSFAELSESMTLVYPQKPEKYTPEINTKIVDLIPVEDKRSKVRKMLDYIAGKVHRYGKETYELFDPHKFDVAVFDTSNVSFHLIDKAKRSGLKVITIHHNFQLEYARDDMRPPKKYLTLFWTRIFEKKAVVLSDLNLTLTKTDAESLQKYYSEKSNFAVLGSFEFEKQELNVIEEKKSNHSRSFVITGQLSSVQTENSLIPWIKEYSHAIKDEFPDSSLIITGRNPSERLKTICLEYGIELIPSPKDIEAIVRGCNYYLCPTSLGSGIKLRVMDGLHNGLMVIAHSRSARGYESMINNGIMFSYNDLKSFREALHNLSLARYTKNEVRKTYMEYFSLEAGTKRLDNILKTYGFKENAKN